MSPLTGVEGIALVVFARTCGSPRCSHPSLLGLAWLALLTPAR